MLNENVLLKPNNISAWLNFTYQQILSPYSIFHLQQLLNNTSQRMAVFVQAPYTSIESTFCPQPEDPWRSGPALIMSHREYKQWVNLSWQKKNHLRFKNIFIYLKLIILYIVISVNLDTQKLGG